MLPGLTGIKSGASPAAQRGRPQRGAAHGDHAVPNFTPCTPGLDPTPERLRPWGTAPILPVPAVPTSHPPSPPSPPPPRGTVGTVTDGLVGLQLEGRKEKRSQPEERAIQIVLARLPWPLEPRGLARDHPGGGVGNVPAPRHVLQREPQAGSLQGPGDIAASVTPWHGTSPGTIPGGPRL